MENKYLEKIAEKQQKNKVGFGKSLGAVVGAGVMTGGVADGISNAAFTNSKMYTGKGYEHEADGHTMRKFIKEHKLKVSFTDKNPDKYKVKNTFFNSGLGGMIKNHNSPAYVHAQHHGYSKNFVTRNKGRMPNTKMNDVIMHELGHARNWRDMPKSVGIAYALNKGGLGTLASIGGSSALLANEKTEKYAPLAAVAHQAPTLLDETMAHVHAFRAIKKGKGVAAGLRFLKNTAAPALSTYGAHAAGEIGGVSLAKHIVHKMRNPSK